jgi:hypothetical protein
MVSHVTHMPSKAIAGRINMVVARSAINAVGFRARPLSTAGPQSDSNADRVPTSDRGLCLGSHVLTWSWTAKGEMSGPKLLSPRCMLTAA